MGIGSAPLSCVWYSCRTKTCPLLFLISVGVLRGLAAQLDSELIGIWTDASEGSREKRLFLFFNLFPITTGLTVLVL